MGDSIIRTPRKRTRARLDEKPDDQDFVTDLLHAYEVAAPGRSVELGYRIQQLMLKGVRYERLEMRKRSVKSE